MSDSLLTDDDLDQRVRAAAAALAALAAPARLDGLAARVDAELADLDAHGAGARMPLETSMTSDTDDKSKPEPITPPKTRSEDSGLHDIRALAQTTRQRISRRITSQHDVDDQMLASSTGSLRAIALPEPAMVVALPDAPSSMAEVHAASVAAPATATAHPGAPVTPIGRRRTGLWVGVGAAGLAAAAAVVLVAGGGGRKKSTEPQTAAATGSAAAAPAVTQDPMRPEAASTAPPREFAVAPAPGAGSAAPAVAPGAGAMAPPTVSAGGAAGPDGKNERDRGDKGEARDPKPTGGGAGSGSAAVKPGAGSGATKPGGGDAKTGGGKPGGGGGAGSGAGSGEKSIEDLLNDASGGAAKPKDDGTPTPPAAKEKTALEPKEIKAGMSAVAGSAQACFGKHGVAGHVKVKAVVAPSGSVSKVDAIGEFAGTPTGGCVAAAVKGASFPSWTGAPMTVTYSFTLQE